MFYAIAGIVCVVLSTPVGLYGFMKSKGNPWVVAGVLALCVALLFSGVKLFQIPSDQAISIMAMESVETSKGRYAIPEAGLIIHRHGDRWYIEDENHNEATFEYPLDTANILKVIKERHGE